MARQTHILIYVILWFRHTFEGKVFGWQQHHNSSLPAIYYSDDPWKLSGFNTRL